MLLPEDPGYEKQVAMMRLDLATNFESFRQRHGLEIVCRKMFEEQGRDFDKEFAEYMANK